MVVEVKVGLRPVELPYTVRLSGVTEQLFEELADEKTKAELLDGVMVVHSPASPRHNAIGRFLRRLMSAYAEAREVGEVFGPEDLVHLATCRSFAPDGFFLEQEHVPAPLPRKQFEGTPDLVAEVLSPFNRDFDLDEKRPAYREAGVRELWIIDPLHEEVLVDRRRGRRYTTRRFTAGRVPSTVLRGFWIEVAWLWAEPLPKVSWCLRQILG